MSYFNVWERESMKVFISWSGTKSQEVAKVLKRWIPCVIQSVEPYFSSADIDKGARWSTDIAKELQDASFGILCVTKDNLSSAWLNFEAGALSKYIDQSKVCPFLIDLKPSEIQNSPILQFQMASTTKDDVFKLFKSINSNLGDSKLNEDVLDRAFNAFWPEIEKDLELISTMEESNTPVENDARDPIEEILELVRYQYKLLKSPEELLPQRYLLETIRLSNMIFPRHAMLDIGNQLREIDVLISNLLAKCRADETLDDISADGAMFVGDLQEIQNRVHRLSVWCRRYLKELDFVV